MSDQSDFEVNEDGPCLADPSLGLPGPATPLPDDDADRDEPVLIHDDDPEDDDLEGDELEDED